MKTILTKHLLLINLDKTFYKLEFRKLWLSLPETNSVTCRFNPIFIKSHDTSSLIHSTKKIFFSQGNTWQVVMAYSSQFSFVVYTYQSITWTYGSASRGISGQVIWFLIRTVNIIKQVSQKKYALCFGEYLYMYL